MKVIQIYLSSDRKKIFVKFAYDQEIVAECKKCFLIWDKREKAWHIPATGCAACNIIRHFTGAGVTVAPTEDILRMCVPYYDAMLIKENCLKELKEKKITAGPNQTRNYQTAGIAMIEKLDGCMLAFDMRLGKTKTVIDYFNRMGKIKDDVLIVCPKSLAAVWECELEKYARVPYQYYDLVKGKNTSGKLDLMRLYERNPFQGVKIYAVNYESVWRGVLGEHIKDRPWGLVVADEIQRIKTANGKASKFMLSLDARRRVGLTGTPFPHSPLDIYGQYRFLDRSVYGHSHYRFKESYSNKDFFGGVAEFKNLDELYSRFEAIAFRLNRADVFDYLPQMISEMRLYDLDKETAAVYQSMEKDMYVKIKFREVTAANVISKIMKLQQITSGFLRDTPGQMNLKIADQKCDILRDLVENEINDDRFIIFYRFDHDRHTISELLNQLNIVHGCMCGEVNEYAAWKDGAVKAMVIQQQAGGLGIDLSAARHVIYFSLNWSLGDYEQSLARVFMPGQTEEKKVYHILAKNTIDQKIYWSLINRRNLIQDMIKGS